MKKKTNILVVLLLVGAAVCSQVYLLQVHRAGITVNFREVSDIDSFAFKKSIYQSGPDSLIIYKHGNIILKQSVTGIDSITFPKADSLYLTLSPTQKEFATTFNTMYGTGSAEQVKANAPAKVGSSTAASTSTALPKEFVYDTSTNRVTEVYDYSNPDTTKVARKAVDIESGVSQGTFVDKIYKDADGNLVKIMDGAAKKYTIDPSDSKVVETVLNSINKYKYIPQNDSTVVKKSLLEGGIERVIKIVKRVNL